MILIWNTRIDFSSVNITRSYSLLRNLKFLSRVTFALFQMKLISDQFSPLDDAIVLKYLMYGGVKTFEDVQIMLYQVNSLGSCFEHLLESV